MSVNSSSSCLWVSSPRACSSGAAVVRCTAAPHAMQSFRLGAKLPQQACRTPVEHGRRMEVDVFPQPQAPTAPGAPSRPERCLGSSISSRSSQRGVGEAAIVTTWGSGHASVLVRTKHLPGFALHPIIRWMARVCCRVCRSDRPRVSHVQLSQKHL